MSADTQKRESNAVVVARRLMKAFAVVVTRGLMKAFAVAVARLLMIAFAAVVVMFLMIAVIIKVGEFPRGAHCLVNKDTFAPADEASLQSYYQAKAAGDDIGISELVRKGKGVYVATGSEVLILDVIPHIYPHFRRRVRILSGDTTGAAGWIDDDCLTRKDISERKTTSETAQETATPYKPRTSCPAPHTHLESGICTCDDGYIRDPWNRGCKPR
jgi:hypothetical protein